MSVEEATARVKINKLLEGAGSYVKLMAHAIVGARPCGRPTNISLPLSALQLNGVRS